MLAQVADYIPSGVLHDLPINPAGFTGRQIMKGIHPLRDGSVFAAHVAENGIKPPGSAAAVLFRREKLPVKGGGWV